MRRLKLSIIPILILASTIVLFQNCGKRTDLKFSDKNTSTVNGLNNAAIGILDTNCASCHNAGNANGGINDITNPNYLVYTRLVVAGEPDLSPLYTEVAEGQMPPTGPLSSSDIAILKQWVMSLAINGVPGGTLPPATALEAKYSVLSAQVFVPRCVACHAGKNQKFDTYDNVMKSVSPGNLANSSLYQAITVGAGGAGKMPVGGSLTAAQIQAIQQWILAGAPNN